MFWFWSAVALARQPRTEDPPPPVRPEVTNGPVEVAAQPGSLWNEVQARRLMGLDGGARQVGDLVTVRIVEQTSTSLDADTDLSKSSEVDATLSALLGAEKTLTDAHPDMGGLIALGAASGSTYNGSGQTTRGSAVETMLTCEVIEVLINGNLRVWGYKQVRVNRETQYVVVEGTVRPRDIQMDNTVLSDLLANAKIEITGTGVVSDKQGPGLLARVLDRIWPF